MALTKEVTQDKIEIVSDHKHIQIREKTTIFEDGKQISSKYSNRYVLNPGTLDGSNNLVDTDISGESTEVKGIANVVWTDDVKTAWKNKLIADKSEPGA
tara:strand:- start:44 stop:340 length:297 start_codon:yes stop_codon:yes gene_type:complete